MMVEEVPLSYLLDQRWSLDSFRYEAAACLALVTYEWMLLFAAEVEFVHKKRWTWFKALYLACRYYPFIGLIFTAVLWQGNHTREVCLHYINYQLMALVAAQIFPYVILLVRCYVFLERRRWFLIFLIITVLSGLFNQVAAMRGEKYVVDNQFKFTGKFGCFRDWQSRKRETKYLGFALLLPLIVDGISTFLILRHYQKNSEVQSPLAKLFVQQAVLYFSVVLILSSVTAGFQILETQLSGRVLVLLMTVPNLMACRLILQLREEAATPTPSEAGEQLSFVVRRALHQEFGEHLDASS